MLPTLFFLLFGAETPDSGIVSVQREIAAADGIKGYYSTTYSKEETLYWQQIPAWIRSDAANRKVKRVLDIGCGYGTLLGFATQTYRAAGYCMDFIDYLRPAFFQPRKLTFAKGNIELDPIPWGEKFDVIVMTEVLEHFNFNPAPTLKKIHDALPRGGVLFLSTPDEKEWGREFKYYKKVSAMPMPDRSAKVVDAHVFIYSKAEVTKLLSDAGFRIEKFDYSPGVGHRHFNIMASAN